MTKTEAVRILREAYGVLAVDATQRATDAEDRRRRGVLANDVYRVVRWVEERK